MSIAERNENARNYSKKCMRREQRKIDRHRRKIDKILTYSLHASMIILMGATINFAVTVFSI